MAEMKDYGIQYVTPDRVKIDPPVEENWQTTKDGGGGLTRDDINRGLDHRKDVGALYEGGYNEDDFHRMRDSSDPNDRAIGDSQRMFYGDHPITVTKNGDEFTSDNGRHRLDVAQDRGESSLPMRVYAAPDDPEFADKPYDAARPQPQREKQQQGDYMSEREKYSLETPESNNAMEKQHLDEHPDLHSSRESAQQQSSPGDDHALPQAPHEDSAYTDKAAHHDPMDGSPSAAHTEGADQMDGATEKPKALNVDTSNITDATGMMG